MNESITDNDFFKKLPKEVQEKLKTCKSEEEAMEILKDNMIEIPPDELKKVSGGINWLCATDLNCVSR